MKLSPNDLAGRVGVATRARSLTDLDAIGAPTGRPSNAARSRELAAVVQVLRLGGAAPRLLRAPRAPLPGHVVIDVPGWRAPESTSAPLRAFLRRLGYDARPWGFGTNFGRPEADAERLAGDVVALAERHGPISLIGWSLGGVVIREVARAHPDCVARVITYGTPVVGGPTHTVGADVFGVKECARITELSEQLDRESPLQVPVTVIFTRRDGVVSWRACLDRHTPRVEHVEVTSTHLGLGIDPDVWTVVADRLARDRVT